MKDGELFFRTDARDEAKALVLEHHYSHRWPAAVQFVLTWHLPGGLFGDRGPAFAACCFGQANRGWAEPLWELQRIAMDPQTDPRPKITRLIAAAAAEIRRKGLQDLLISYADPSESHHGGLYQAASWNYNGLSQPNGAQISVNGRIFHKRSASSTFGSAGLDHIRECVPDGIVVERVDFVRKHLYWRALNRRGKAKAKRLGLESLPYPKPGEKKP